MRRSSLLLALCAAACFLSAAVPVFADTVGPALSRVAPSTGAILATGSQKVRFEAYDADRVSLAHTRLFVDGSRTVLRSDYAQVFIPQYVDDEECGGDWAIDYTRMSGSSDPLTLADGLHTFRIEATDVLGNLTVREWQVTVAEKPTIGGIVPVAGSRATGTEVALGATIADAGGVDSSTVFVRWRIANAGSPAGEWQALASTFEAVSGRVTSAFRPPAPETRYEIEFSATDAAGNVAIATTNVFVGGSAPTMVAGSACGSCHTSHVIDDCSQCHDRYRYDMYPCEDCHDVPEHDAVLLSGVVLPRYHTSTPVGRTCASCHSGPHGQDLESQRHATTSSLSCVKCHARSLTTEHASRTDAVGAAFTCETCHDSDEPSVVAAIAAGNTACAACHPSADHESFHVSVTSGSCFGTGCHDASKSLAAVHSQYAGDGSEYGYATSCELCHENRDPDRIDWATATTACTGSCHSGTTHSQYGARHALSTASNDCAQCHGSDLSGVHGATGDLTRCAWCHAKPDNWSKSADCSNCHQPHGDVSTAHASSIATDVVYAFSSHTDGEGGPAGIALDCRRCHDPNLTTVHSGNCLACHAGAAPARTIDTWNGSCQQGACHVTYHDGAQAAHTTGYCDAYGCHDGATWAVSATYCGSCHGFRDWTAPVTSSNARAVYGSFARITLTATDDENGSGVASTYYRVDGGTAMEGTSILIPGPVEGAQAHSVEFWSVDGAGNEEVHQQIALGIAPDIAAPTTVSDIKDTYEGGAIIRLTPSDPSPSSEIARVCYRLDGGAVSEGTVVSVFTGGTHTLEYWSVDGAGNEETPHTTRVFSILTDTIAPTTTVWLGIYESSYTPPTADEPAYYRGQPFVEMSAVDAGGSGVAHTYWTFDGGPEVEYARFHNWVQGPHVITYWSIDEAGNAEEMRTFAWVTDYTGPSIVTDAQPIYVGSATIQLAAEDPHSGVRLVQWSLDGSPMVNGNVVTCDTEGEHVLDIRAVNKAGLEQFQRLSFYLEP